MVRAEQGFSLVELLLALALAALAVTAFVDVILYTEIAGAGRFADMQARLRAGECLEASRWIRDTDGLDALTEGTHGLDVATGHWELSGISDVTDGFTRVLEVAAYDDDSAMVTCTISWDDGSSRSFGLTTLLSR